MPNIETILRDHVTLQIECIDRLYLNGYQPRLQCEGGLVHFLLRDPERRVPSPALLGQMTARFVAAIERFAEEHYVPIVRPWNHLDRVLDMVVAEAKLVA